VNYQHYCKPTLSAALHSVGLDKQFHRAEGQYLYHYDAQGQEREVLDLLGGYGAVILGHNHPVLLDTLKQQIEQKVAFHNQFSLRSGAGDLAARLNPILQRETGWKETFMCAFASTGAESVEVAIKHAELMRSRQLDQLQEKLKRTLENTDTSIDWQIDEAILEDHPQLLNDDIVIKLDSLHQWNHTKLNQAPLFIALKHAFHGKLNTSIQLTHGTMYRHPFRRFGLNTHFFTPAELTDEAIERLKEDASAYVLGVKKQGGKIRVQKIELPLIAAILVEPVQGEGGVYCLSEADAERLHRARERLNCPLIADEIQSGCGRCGSFLAGSQIGLKPDYVVLSKGLGGGISKIGVVAIRASRYADGFDMIQSSTFGEDDWSARIADTFVELLSENDQALLSRVGERGEALGQALRELHQAYPDIIRDVRGKGLLYGLELQDLSHSASILIKTMDYQEATGYLLSGCLLARWGIRVAPPASSGRVVRIEPSIQLTDANIQYLVSGLEILCLALRYQDTGYLLAHLLDDSQALKREPTDYRPGYSHLGIVPAVGEADVKVAFINHLISSEWIKEVDPSLAHLTDSQTALLLNRLSFDRRVAPFAPVRIRSRQGQSVDFILYPINATSQQIDEMMATNQLDTIRSAIDERLAMAREDGCRIAGLGMFTSIVTNNAKAVETSGIHLTTGNALTVAMAAEAIEASITEHELSIKHAAVIGAAGNIGSVYSTLLAEYCTSLLLVGSGRMGSIQRVLKTAELVYATVLNEMAQHPEQQQGLVEVLRPYAEQNNWLQDDFLKQASCGKLVYAWFEQHLPEAARPIQVSENLDDLKQADLLVCAANSSEDFIQDQHLKTNVLICDIAVPYNISETLLAKRPDIQCLRGGIVNTPNGESLDPRARAYLKTGQLYACMAETVVLGLSNYQGHYSYGNITKQQVKTIMQLAAEHGLALAEYKTAESM
jgi:acetylornithine/succinyldiaminopimelate/putrescine aminotransferase/predicted amino acid dehydrogenase